MTLLAAAATAAAIYTCFAYADRVEKVLGRAGTDIAVRLLTLILFCIGVQILWPARASSCRRCRLMSARPQRGLAAGETEIIASAIATSCNARFAEIADGTLRLGSRDLYAHVEPRANGEVQQHVERKLIDLAIQQLVEPRLGNAEPTRRLDLCQLPPLHGTADGDHQVGAYGQIGRLLGVVGQRIPNVGVGSRGRHASLP
jgi:hypothetical protein